MIITMSCSVAIFLLCVQAVSPNSQYVTLAAINAAKGVQLKMRLYPILFSLCNVPLSLQVWSPDVMQASQTTSLYTGLFLVSKRDLVGAVFFR